MKALNSSDKVRQESGGLRQKGDNKKEKITKG